MDKSAAKIAVAVIDNRDSFVYNLSRYLEELEVATTLLENDVEPTSLTEFDGVLLSPGPGRPEDAGKCIEIVHWAEKEKKPLLGVCLGHQVIAHAYGFEVSGANQLLHGYRSTINHDGTGIFTGIKKNFNGARYHSLAIKALQEPLIVTATSEDGTIMALAHQTAPILGLQFHPESVLTEYGHKLLENWISTFNK